MEQTVRNNGVCTRDGIVVGFFFFFFCAGNEEIVTTENCAEGASKSWSWVLPWWGIDV